MWPILGIMYNADKYVTGAYSPQKRCSMHECHEILYSVIFNHYHGFIYACSNIPMLRLTFETAGTVLLQVQIVIWG